MRALRYLRPRFFLLVCLLPAALCLGLSGCSNDPEDPEVQIRERLGEFVTAIEQREIEALRDWIAADYRDKRHVNRRDVMASVFLYTRRHRSIHLFTHVQSINVDPDGRRADLLVDLAMTGRAVQSAEELADLRADLYRFDVTFRWDTEADDWLVETARWQRSELSALLP